MTCSLGSVSNCGPERSIEDFLPLRASNTCAWATLLTRLPDLDDSVLAAGHATADPELVVLRVHRDDLEIPDRDGLVAHLAWHLLALEDPGRVGRGPHRSRLPDVVRAVRHGPAAEAVALDGALETAALGGRAHMHLVAYLEGVRPYRVADLARNAAQLLEVPARRTAVMRLGSTSMTVTLTSVPSSWKAWVMCFLRPKTAVAIAARSPLSLCSRPQAGRAAAASPRCEVWAAGCQ